MLVKYGKHDRLTSLLETGKLYLSPIEALRSGGNKKKDNHQIDHLEGAERFFFKNDVDLTMTPNPNGPPLKIKAVNLTYTVKNSLVSGNVVSFYAISEKSFLDGKFSPIDPKMTDFGSHALVITNVAEFMNRVKQVTIQEAWSSLHADSVEYFDETDFADNLNLFQKRSSYEYQKEYRIFIQSNQFTPVEIDLGPLKDIAFIVPAEATLTLDLELDSIEKSVKYKFYSKVGD